MEYLGSHLEVFNLSFILSVFTNIFGQIHGWLKYNDTRDIALEDLRSFMIISRRIIFRLKKNLRRNCRGKENRIICRIPIFLKKSAFNEITRNSKAEPDRHKK